MRSFLCSAWIAGCVVVASACSSSSGGNGQGSDGDAGAGNDSGVTIPDVYQGSPDTGGGSSDAGNSGSTCPTPADLTSWTPPAYHAATGKYQGSCTQAQLTGFYNDCLGSSSSSTACNSNWQSSAPAANKACTSCLVTDPATATKWGPLLLYPIESINVAGCVELLSGDTSCATTLQQLQDCEHEACDTTCPLTADPSSFTLWQMCVATADGAACKSYTDAANTCAAGLADGGASVCLQSYTTFSDYYDAIAPVFCGSPGGTADDASTD